MDKLQEASEQESLHSAQLVTEALEQVDVGAPLLTWLKKNLRAESSNPM